MRRFAVIDVPVPEKDDYLEILNTKGQTGSITADERVQALIDLPFRKLGPAILLDVAAFVRERLRISPNQIDAALEAALLAFVLPQLDDLSRSQQVEITKYLQKNVLKGLTAIRAARIVADTFHAAPEDLMPEESPDDSESIDT